MKNTVRLHRILTAKPEKVYRAFIEPDAMAKWLGFKGEVPVPAHLIIAELDKWVGC